jgi:hypothetical protein
MKLCIPLLLLCLVFPACAPSTPQARIEKYPEKFAALDKREQSLVAQGQIDRGMSGDAVMLAWGFPEQRFEGSSNSQLTERWDYATSVPVQTTGFVYGPYGFGNGRLGPRGRWVHPGAGIGLGPEIIYIPRRVASVWFIDKRVDSWERLR